MSEQAVLMRLVETAEGIEPDWQDALNRAGYLGRRFPRRKELLRPRRILLLAAVVLVVTYAVAAVAADKPPGGVVYWLFDRSGATYPVKQSPAVGEWAPRERAGAPVLRIVNGVPRGLVVPVIQGSVAGHRFEMQAFHYGGHLQIGLHPGGTPKPYHGSHVPALDFVQAGAPIHGVSTGDELHWVGLGVAIPGPIEPSGGGTGPKWLFGAAAPNVARVDLEDDNDGTVVSVPTFAGPSELEPPIRLWVAALRLDRLVHEVVPRDKDGKALEHWHLEIAQ
jgi:hypothetical protein